MIATELSLWKSPTPNYIINSLFCFYDECLCTCVHVCACVCILVYFYDNVMHCTFADLGSNKVSSTSSSSTSSVNR